MLDLRRIREETDLVKAGLARRGNPAHLEGIDRALELDERRRALIGEVDALRARRNEESQKVATLKRENRNDEADAIIASSRELASLRTSSCASGARSRRSHSSRSRTGTSAG